MRGFRDSGKRMKYPTSMTMSLGGSSDSRVKIDLSDEERKELRKKNVDYLCEFMHQKADEVGIDLNKVYVTVDHKKTSGIVDYEGEPYTKNIRARLEAHHLINDQDVEIFHEKITKVALRLKITVTKTLSNDNNNVVIGLLGLHTIDLDKYDYENTVRSISTMNKFDL